jgi:hypothetical protein
MFYYRLTFGSLENFQNCQVYMMVKGLEYKGDGTLHLLVPRDSLENLMRTGFEFSAAENTLHQ